MGIYSDEHLNFTSCINTLADSGSRALGALISKLKTLKSTRYKTYTSLFTSQVATILDYCSSIWGFKKASQCDNVQNKAIRYFLGVHKFTPIPALWGKMGWFPSKYRRYLCMLRFWNRLIKMDDTRLPKRIFLQDCRQANSNWSHDIREVFKILNLTSVYDSKVAVNIRNVKSQLTTIIEKEWKLELESKPKLRLYKTFKTTFETEGYLYRHLKRQDRSLLAQFRTGVLPLRIETGRYQLKKDPNTESFRKLNVEERTCLICNTGDIENEIHFLCKCSAYEIPRHNLYNIIEKHFPNFRKMSDEDKLSIILKSNDKELVSFICDSWKIRQNVTAK